MITIKATVKGMRRETHNSRGISGSDTAEKASVFLSIDALDLCGLMECAVTEAHRARMLGLDYQAEIVKIFSKAMGPAPVSDKAASAVTSIAQTVRQESQSIEHVDDSAEERIAGVAMKLGNATDEKGNLLASTLCLVHKPKSKIADMASVVAKHIGTHPQEVIILDSRDKAIQSSIEAVLSNGQAVILTENRTGRLSASCGYQHKWLFVQGATEAEIIEHAASYFGASIDHVKIFRGDGPEAEDSLAEGVQAVFDGKLAIYIEAEPLSQ